MKKSNRIIFLVFLFLVIALVAGVFVYRHFFVPNNEMVPTFQEDRLNLVIGDQVIREEPRVAYDEILLSIEVIKTYLDPDIYWDDSLKKVTITTQNKVLRMKTDNLKALINNKPISLKVPATEENNTVYVPIDFLKDFYKIDVTYLKDQKVVIIDFKNNVKQQAEPVKSEISVRRGRSIHEPIIKKITEGNKTEEKVLRVFEEYEKWYKVRTWDGAIGFIQKKDVVVKNVQVSEISEELPDNTGWKPEKGKINLVWEMIYSKMKDPSKIDPMQGLDVVSPTWFQVANDKGTLINRADHRYVDWAHRNGYKVWALLSNDSGDIKMTSRLLRNTDARDYIIKQVLSFASLYKLDGINIDFENIYKEDKEHLTQFVREITPFLKEQGLVVSMDVTVPDGSDTWSRCYDREAIGKVVDYVMLMTYDQHWASSPVAGSVAQITWVEENLKKVLEMVPREKLLLGLPFYTRRWKEETGSTGKSKLASTVLKMAAAKDDIKANQAVVSWDEESGQFFAEYKKENALYKIWLENEDSIDLKSSLVLKYNLAGAASWRRSDEVPEIWSVLEKNLKKYESYEEWTEVNKNRKYVF
ncbi:MAG: glycosyl hydrolase family 18 protein [Clostridia bacterium]|nr:glycosyl hydrolase family 18 protein [Clostridia bacterium]